MSKRWTGLLFGACLLPFILFLSAPAMAQQAQAARTHKLPASPCFGIQGDELTPCLIKHANALKKQAIEFTRQGDPRSAIVFLKEVVALYRETLGEKHIYTLDAMYKLASRYHQQGRHDDAIILERKVLQIRREELGEKHPDILDAMARLAFVHHLLRRYEEALVLRERVLHLHRETLGEEHMTTLSSMANLSATYHKLGRYGESAILLEKVLKGYREELGEKHPDTLLVMTNLSLTYLEMGRYKETLILQVKILKLQRELSGEKHPNTLFAMIDLASTYRKLGRLGKATMLFEKVLQIRREELGEKHPDTLASMAELGFAYRAQGRYEAALALDEEVLKLRREVLGEKHPDTLLSMVQLAKDYLTSGRHIEATVLLEKAEQNTLERIQRKLMLDTGTVQLRTLARKEVAFIDLALNLDGLPTTKAFASTFSWQGVAVRGEMQWRDLHRLRASFDESSKDARLLEAMRDINARLEQMSTSPPLGKNARRMRERTLETLEKEEKALERRARAEIEGYATLRRSTAPSVKRLCERLSKEDASLLQVVSYNRFSRRYGKEVQTQYYAMFTVSPSKRGCEMVRKDMKASRVEEAVSAWLRKVEAVERCVESGPSVCTQGQQKKAHREMHMAGTSLRKVVWAPFEKNLQSERVYIVPDGVLDQVSFASLPDEKDTFLIEQKTLRYIPYAAALDGPEREEVPSRGALFIGDLDHGKSYKTPEKALSNWQICSSKGCVASRKFRSSTPGEKVWEPMGSQTCGYEERSWARLETGVEEQAARFAKSTGEDALLVKGSQAHEKALREKMGGRRVLHLATHGFFSPKEQCGRIDISMEDVHHVSKSKKKRNWRRSSPLQMSALVLSGGNKAASRQDRPEEDGLLNAKEVVRLDLRGTEVVTLAACETGLGENTVGDGSHGLANAFLVAGAKTAFVSHWQAPHGDTNALFQRFYADAFPSKGARPDAVDTYHEVVRASIEQHRSDGNIHSAFFWAAFFPLQIR